MRTYIIEHEAILGSVHPSHVDRVYSAGPDIARASVRKNSTKGCHGILPSPRWIRARERPQEARHPRIQIQDVYSTRRVVSTGGNSIEVLKERESPTAQLDRVCTVG